jgi:hypothetical protein
MSRVYKRNEVVRGLTRKRFRSEELREGHTRLVLLDEDDRETSVRTKVSRGPDHDIGKRLFSKMARQCHLTTGQFREYIDCPMGYPHYMEHLRSEGVIG